MSRIIVIIMALSCVLGCTKYYYIDCHDSVAQNDMGLHISSQSMSDEKITINIEIANNTDNEICFESVNEKGGYFIQFNYIYPYRPFSGWALQVLYSDSLYMDCRIDKFIQFAEYEIPYTCVDSSSEVSDSLEIDFSKLFSIPNYSLGDNNTLYGKYSIQLFYHGDTNDHKNGYRGCLVSNIIDVEYLNKTISLKE